jgi:autotransporter translocation and assembly factor TamB
MTSKAPLNSNREPPAKKAPARPWLAWGGLFFTVIIAFLGGCLLLLQTNRVQQQIQSKINATLPGAVIWEQGRISPFNSSVELRHGRLLDPEQRTVATFDRLAVRFNLFALLNRTVDIAFLTLDAPHVDLVNTPNGLNINRVFTTPGPEAPAPKDESASSFKWTIRSLRIHNGHLEFDDPAGQLKTKATAIELTGEGNFIEQKGTADLAIGALEIQSPRFSQRFASLALRAQLIGSRLRPLSITVRTSHSQLSLKGKIERLFEAPYLDLTVVADLDLSELKALVPVNDGLNGRLLARLQAQGDWYDPQIALVLTSDEGGPFLYGTEDLKIDLTMKNRMVDLKEARFSFAGGKTRLTGAIDLRALFPRNLLHYERNFADVRYHLSLVSDDVDLAPLCPPGTDMTGVADGRLDISGRGLDPLHSIADVTVGVDTRRIKTPWLRDALDIQITLTGQLENGTAAWSGLRVHSNGIDLTSDGQFHLDSRHINASMTLNLPELSRALAPLGAENYKGTLTMDAAISGSIHSPELELKLIGQELQTGSHRLGNLFLAGRYADERLAIPELRLVNNTSKISIDGYIGLKDPQSGTWTSDPAIALSIQEATVELQDFFRAMRGRLTFQGALAGTVRDPNAKLQIEGEDIDLAGQAIEFLSGTAHLQNYKVSVGPFALGLPRSAPITMTGTYQFDGGYTVDISAKGVDLGAIAAVEDQSLVQGLLDLQLSGRGSVADPQLNGAIQLRQLRINGNPSEDVSLALSLQDGTARVGGDVGFALTGAYAFERGEFDLSADFKDTDLAAYFTLFNRPRYGGRLTGHITAHGNVARMAEMQARVDLTDIGLNFRDQSVVKTGQVTLTLSKGEATFSRATLKLLKEGFLRVEGKMDLAETLDLRIMGALPAEALQILRPETPTLSGNIELGAQITGTRSNPVYKADIVLSDIGGTIPDLKHKMHRMNGRIHIDPEKVVIEDLKGLIEDGSFGLSGVLEWVDFEPQRIDLALTAQKLPIDMPEKLMARIDGNLQFSGHPGNSRLSGRLVIHDGLYYQDVNLREVLTAKAKSSPSTAAAQKRPGPMGWENIGLDLVVERGGVFRVENNLSELDVDLNLHLAGHLDRPVVNGRSEVVSGEIHFPVLNIGTLAQTSWIPATTQTFVVQRGVIDFINPSRIEPHLDIRGQVTIRHWHVYLDISGTPEALEFKLSSNPSESEADIVSLLLTGRTAGEMAGGGNAARLTSEQRLMEFTASTFQSDIKAFTGLDVIETGSSPGDADGGEASVTVTVGKNLSERLTLKYATESRGADIINSVIAEYRILENIRAQGFQNTAGNFGGSLNFRHEFR